MNEIRLFIASSNELADFRNKIDTWVAGKNRIFEEKGLPICVKVDKWEFESTAIPSSGRSQDRYNELIKYADVVAVVFKNKAGDFTIEEFNEALKIFKEKGKPRISVYALPSNVNKNSSQNEIDEKYKLTKFLYEDLVKNFNLGIEYFHAKADNYDALWNMINNELDRAIDINICLSSATYFHPTAFPLKLEELLRRVGYHATSLDKENSNGIPIEKDIPADDFCFQHLFEEVSKNRSIIITGEGGSGKSTLIARFFETTKEKVKLFYIPVYELDYGLDDTRQVSISDYLFREYFRNKKNSCQTPKDVFSFIRGLDDSIFILDGYNELEFYAAIQDGGGGKTRQDILDTDINDLRAACQNRVIITSRSNVSNIRAHCAFFRIQRVRKEVVREFLKAREDLLMKHHYLSDGEKNDLVENLTTPILLNAFDGMLRGDDLLSDDISVGMFERPTNKGQIFYNYLCNEMFINRDTHTIKPGEYAARGLIFLRYVVPFMAREWYRNNTTLIMPDEKMKNKLKSFLEVFDDKYVKSGVFGDLNVIAEGYNTKELKKLVASDIGDDGSKAFFILVNDYNILKMKRASGFGNFQRYSFEHPVLGEVLAALDIWNQMALQNEDPNFNIVDDIMAKPLPFEVKELLADFCATKEN